MKPSLAPLLAIALCACGARAPSTTTLSTGTEDLDRTRASVVFLSSDCSGVLIAPRLVLTAAHCVLGLDALPEVSVRRGALRWDARVAGCRLHPRAAPAGTERCEDRPLVPTRRAHDLALLQLAGAVPPSIAEPVPVLIAPPHVASAPWWRGRRVRLVGWHRRPAVVGPARRYSGMNVITSVRDGVLVTVPGARRGFSTRVGASGGPALLEVDGREHVVGILFGGERADSRDSIYAATFSSQNAAWLVRVAPEAFVPDLDAVDGPVFAGLGRPLHTRGD